MPEETETPPEPWLARRGTTAQCLAVLALSAVFTVAELGLARDG